MRSLGVLLLLLAGCVADDSRTPSRHSANSGGACTTSDDCPTDMWCLEELCSPRWAAEPQAADAATPRLSVTPASLNFGALAPGGRRTLSLLLENTGDTMIIITAAALVPTTTDFRVEPMGHGPFWIRPGRARALFVSFVPTTTTHAQATLSIASAAPTASIRLQGN